VPRRPLSMVLALAALLPCASATCAGDDPADRYRETAGRILGRALVDEGAWAKLEHLTTRIGHRLSGSPGLEKAVAWAHEGMTAEGLEGVRLQPVKVLAAPGGLVPSADPGQEFIRVVYQDPPGRELWLDQQRPAPASEFARSRSAESVLPGDTLPVPAEAGSRSVQWIDQHGFLLRLTGFLPGDSLRAMIPRVH